MFGFGKRVNVNDLRMYCIRGQERINLLVQRKNADIAKMTSSIVERYKKGELELAKIQVEGLYNEKKTVFALQLLQVYLTTVDSRINVIETEKNVPANMETCIGSILACRGKMEVDELDPICDILEKKYADAIPMLKNSCDNRIATRLIPSIPTATEIDSLLSDILKRNGAAYVPAAEAPMPPIILPVDTPNAFAMFDQSAMGAQAPMIPSISTPTPPVPPISTPAPPVPPLSTPAPPVPPLSTPAPSIPSLPAPFPTVSQIPPPQQPKTPSFNQSGFNVFPTLLCVCLLALLMCSWLYHRLHNNNQFQTLNLSVSS